MAKIIQNVPTKKGFQCNKNRILRPVKKTTLEKESCEKLFSRFVCYGDIVKKKKNGKIRHEIIDIASPNEKPMAETIENLYHILGNRNCPIIPNDKLVEKLETEFPHHKFSVKYRTVKIPQSFTTEELHQLDSKIGDLTFDCYKLKHNNRLDQYYLSYVRKKPIE
ncbi:MAG: hypothetical protein WC934_04865 [Acidithiobacillus sp.]|jgi:hypothetical protein|uniref:hypothetical protein n=1 Tax=Acidithiobacillus sp. TaxID=1872118 RepID=UPI00355DE08A